jgi:hypothetical protein
LAGWRRSIEHRDPLAAGLSAVASGRALAHDEVARWPRDCATIGKVLGEGTYIGKIPINSVARVTGLKVPITKGETYFLDFLPLGGAVTYWYRKTEPVIYSEWHKKLVEGPPEKYEWIEEAEAAPIGLWANGT